MQQGATKIHRHDCVDRELPGIMEEFEIVLSQYNDIGTGQYLL